MKTTVAQTNQVPMTTDAGTRAHRQRIPFAAGGRWLSLALVAGFTLAAQAHPTATATATTSYGFVVDYTVTDGGSGYSAPPLVTVVGGGGTGATAVALVANGAVAQINAVSAGSGYTSPPDVIIADPGPQVLVMQRIPLVTIRGMPGSTNQIETATSLEAGAVWNPLAMVVLTNSVQECYDRLSPPQTSGFYRTAQAGQAATATATVISGFVVAYTVTDGGAGYTVPPMVTVVGGGGTGATAVAVTANGAVTQINAMSAGSGYTNSPKVIIAPAFLALQMIPLVTIYGLPGDTNQIETANSLGAGAMWSPLTQVVLTNDVQEWYDRISAPWAWKFYRSVLVGGSWPTPGQRFVWLPPGTFTMGSPTNEVGRATDEGPQTHVTLTRGFFMGRYQVTQKEYVSVIGSNPSAFTGNTNNLPVEQVSWVDATNYCSKLTTRELVAGRLPAGWAYRLPTEAEFEYAIRAGSTNRFSYGDDPGYKQFGNYAWYSANSSGRTHWVGGKLPNRWGLYDMSGNVAEWCLDRYGNYRGGSVTDPQGPASGNPVLRNGGYADTADRCRSAARITSGSQWGKSSNIGFRVVLAQVRP
jgi:formylglycine-generating enzyme required for sulfatase activity